MSRVTILEDQPLMRDAMASILGGAGYQVAGVYDEPITFLSRIQTDGATVAVIDVMLRGAPSGLDGLEVVRRLKDRHPDVKSVVVSGVEDARLADKAYAAGASGFVDKVSCGARALVQVVSAVDRGEKVFPMQGLSLSPAPARPDRPEPLQALTDRELEVLEWVASGADNLKIAAQLKISERTVKAHVSALYRKLEADNRTELALEALKLGVRPRDR
jgi:two-component system, NarL family, nitrate/nitrite response regulator NarL